MLEKRTAGDLGSPAARNCVDAPQLDGSDLRTAASPPSSERLIEEQEPLSVDFGDGRVVLSRPSRDWESHDGYGEIDITVDVAFLPKLIDRLLAIAIEAGLEPEPPAQPEPERPSRSTAAERSARYRAKRRERHVEHDGDRDANGATGRA